MFGDNDLSVLANVANRQMLVWMATDGNLSQLAAVLDLLDKFKTRWRVFATILEITEHLPRGIAGFLAPKILISLEAAVRINPQSLTKAFVSFYCFVFRTLFDTLDIVDFVSKLHSAYGQDKNYQLRVLFLRLASALISELSAAEYFEYIWPTIIDFLDEKVSLVQVKVVQYLIDVLTKLSSHVAT
jgi:hypothetical protein